MKHINTNLGNPASSNVITLDERFTLETGIDVSKKERGVNLNPVVGSKSILEQPINNTKTIIDITAIINL